MSSMLTHFSSACVTLMIDQVMTNYHNEVAKTFYSLYINKRYLPCVFMLADCGSDVIVAYDVIDH